MAVSDLHLSTFKELFTGNSQNYGQHVYKHSDEGEKEKGDNRTITNKLLTIAEYRTHLAGDTGLGIIPITQDNKCKFTVIDIDIYNQDLTPYITAIEGHNLPLVPFYSKSGGLHVYIFFKQFVKAQEAVKLTGDIARILGFNLLVKNAKNENLEIFPKQTKLNKDQVGNWINLPYFNAENSRQAICKTDGSRMTLDEGLKYIQSKVTTIAELEQLITDLPYNDAPPCIQTLTMLNTLTIDNGRNNFLFSCGVYLKKKDENYFEARLMEINEILQSPLEPKEVEATILSSLRKKDYAYKCNVSPCLDFCDKKICKNREYGVGKDGGYFTELIFGKLVQYASSTPYYEWQVKINDKDAFKELRFKNEDEIIRQDAFLRLCFRELRYLPFKMKQAEWFKLVNQALVEIEIREIAKEEDTSPKARFNYLLYEFLTSRAMAKTVDQVRARRVYADTERGRYLFRVKDLIEFLYDVKSFRLFSTMEIHGLLRDCNVYTVIKRSSDGKQLRLNAINMTDVDPEMLLSTESFEADMELADPEEDF